jgi:chemotaxis protein methyltransferase CheR
MSVATLQRELQASEPGATIELGPYLSRLCKTLTAPMIGDLRPISLTVHVEGGTASASQAISIGLIVKELVIKALKHAFPVDRSNGCIIASYDYAHQIRRTNHHHGCADRHAE